MNLKKAIIGYFLIGLNVCAFAQSKSIDQGDKMKDFFRMVKTYYTDTVNEEKLADAAIVKVLEELDPHSAYIPNRDVKRTEESLVGNFEGVGISFNLLKDTILVVEAIPTGPSEKVGIMAGDKIIYINDTLVAGKKITQDGVVKKLRGPKGTKVTVRMLRRGQLLDFTITRDKIPLFSIEAAYMATPTVGYVKLTKFAAPTMQEFYEAMGKLKDQGMQDLILDLQGNGGGYLNTAAQLCNEFIAEDTQMIVYTEGKSSKREPYYSNGKGNFRQNLETKQGRLVVLIDDGSASASEIVSGSMQDIDRAIIVGRRTFGKGLVQKPYYFADGSMVRLTVAHYYTPSGRCIQRPYDNGKKDYYDEYSRRVKSGELFGADTTHFPDSLMFFTKHLRKVYGGGGVVPDIYCPIDTTLNSPYYQSIRGKGTLNAFPLEYVDKNRIQLKAQYPTANDFVKSFVVSDELLEQLYAAGDRDSVKRDAAQMLRSKSLIKNQVKALMGRDLFDNTTFWRITNEINNIYQEGVKVFSTDKFDVLNPSKKELKKAEKEIILKEKEKKKGK